jgi:hypothetical protein
VIRQVLVNLHHKLVQRVVIATSQHPKDLAHGGKSALLPAQPPLLAGYEFYEPESTAATPTLPASTIVAIVFIVSSLPN